MQRLIPQSVIAWNEYVDFCAATATNTAKGKPAKQSSEYKANPGPASRAVDGNRAFYYSRKSCTATKAEAEIQWWTVDLGKRYAVNWVFIQNRWENGLNSQFIHCN